LLEALVVGGPDDLSGSRNMPRVLDLLYVISAQRSALAWKHVVRCVDSSPESPAGGPSVLAPVHLAEIPRLIGAEHRWVCSKSTS
jgi:hypothetical protein